MPVFKIGGADGRIYNIEAPTRDDAIRTVYPQEEFDRGAAVSLPTLREGVAGEMRKVNPLSQAAYGMFTQTPAALAAGAQKFFPDALRGGNKELKAMSGISDASPWGQVGSLVGDIGAMYVPGVGLENAAVKGLSMLPGAINATTGAARLAPRVAGSLAAGAGLGAVASPTSALEGAEEGAIGGAVGTGVGRLLKKTLGGILRPSTDAKLIMDSTGVVPSVGQAVDTSGKWYEHLPEKAVKMSEDLANKPTYSGLLNRSMRTKADQELVGKYVQEALPQGASLPSNWENLKWPEKVAALKQIQDTAYDSALSGTMKYTKKLQAEYTQHLSNVAIKNNLNPDEIQKLHKLVNDGIFTRYAAGDKIPYAEIRTMAETFDRAGARGSAHWKEAMQDAAGIMEGDLNNRLSASQIASLADVDAKAVALRRLTGSPDNPTMRQIGDVRKGVPSSQLDPLLAAGEKVMLPPQPPRLWSAQSWGGQAGLLAGEVPAGLYGLATASPAQRRFLLGQQDKQQILRDALSSQGTRQVLRSIGVSANRNEE